MDKLVRRINNQTLVEPVIENIPNLIIVKYNSLSNIFLSGVKRNFSKKTEEMEPQIQTEQYEENIGNINTQEDLNEN